MSVVSELVEAIVADPRDDGPQLVIADYLLSVDDPRGELIMLDRQERARELVDPAALDRLLLLAAHYSFPRAEPDDPVLAFAARHDGESPYYQLVHADRFYELYPHGGERWGERAYIRVRLVDGTDDDWRSDPLEVELDEWTAAELPIIFRIVSDAIHANTPFADLRFPFGTLAFPQYAGSPLRCYMLPVEFLRAHDLLRNELGLAARDYYRWRRIWDGLRGMTRR